MTDLNLSYMAGIVDGEGSIKICKRKGYHGEINQMYELQIDVTNTNGVLIDYFYEHFGGYKQTQKKRKINHRVIYRWYITAYRAEKFLKLIYPFLLCKKDEADIAFVFRESYDRNRYCRGGLSDEVLNTRKYCYDRLKELHHK